VQKERKQNPNILAHAKVPSIKDVRIKSRKIDLLPLCRKMSALAQWLNLPLSVREHHKFRKIRSFLRKKVRKSASEEPSPPCPKNVRTGQTSSPLSEKYPHWTNPLPPNYGRLLRTAPNQD